MNIEFLIAHDDGTWTTEIHDVPTEDVQDYDALGAYAIALHESLPYRKVVAILVFNLSPEG